MILRSSDLKLWKRCPRHFYLRYVRGLERVPIELPDGVVDIADVGTQVHLALQAHYAGRPAYVPEDELAEIMVRGYFQWLEEEGADVGLRVVAVEEPIQARIEDLKGRHHTVTGRQDLVLHDDAFDRDFLTDHKTVQSLDQYGQQLKVDDQLLNYVLLRKLNGLDTAGAIHNMLRRVKRTARATPPFYGRRQVTFNDTQLRNHYRHVQATLTGIADAVEQLERGTDHAYLFPPSPSKECTWDCPFLPVCPMMDDGSDWEGMLARNYRPLEVH